MLYDQLRSHLSATKGQRSASPSPACCFDEIEIQMDGVKTMVVTLPSVWAPHGEAPVPCSVPLPAPHSLISWESWKLTCSEITTHRTSVLNQPETVMSGSLVASPCWEHTLCVQREFGADLRFVPRGCGLWTGLVLPEGVISLPRSKPLVEE